MYDETLALLLGDRNLSHALRSIKNKMAQKQLANKPQALAGIESDYRLMCNFMMQGYRDPQASQVYDNLLKRTLRLYADLQMETLRTTRPTFIDAASKAYRGGDGAARLQESLEAFVQDVALASLDPSADPKALSERYASHQEFIDRAFATILTSPQWTEAMASDLTQVLLSPTVDTNDAAVLISALTLSVLSVFDLNKWLTLTHIYEQATDVFLRERALVGWMLSMPQDENRGRTEVAREVHRLLESEATRKELLELQIQLFFCCNTEADNTEIQKDILPTLIKGSNLRITRTGIVDMDEDSLKDILDPEAAESELERIEATFKRMKDMQDAGSDVYFGGFSQMKRYSFFYRLSNWFYPFTSQHPQISEALRKIDVPLLEKNLRRPGPFCDSDKYSFVLGVATIISQLPANIKEVLGSSLGLEPVDESTMDREKPVYVRRLYLQDLYRFFNLYHRKGDFQNPFNWKARCFFLCEPYFRNDTDTRDQFCLFLAKHRRYEDITSLYDGGSSPRSADAQIVLAEGYRLGEHYPAACSLYEEALQSRPDDERALKGLARVCFAMHDYRRAAELYRTLTTQHPAGTRYQQNLAISLVSAGDTEEGMKLLYRLHYDHADDTYTTRALAWGSLQSKKPREASELYKQLMAGGRATTADHLNAAYAHWFMQDMSGAVDLFHQYRALNTAEDHSLRQDFASDSALLKLYDISETEQTLMVDIVEQ